MIVTKFILLISMAYTATAIPVIENVLARTSEQASKIDTSDPLQNLKVDLPFSDAQIPGRVQFALVNQNPVAITGSEINTGSDLDPKIFERVQYALVKNSGGSGIVFEKPVVPVKAIELRVLTESEYVKLISDASGISKTISKPPTKYLPVDDGYDYPRPK